MDKIKATNNVYNTVERRSERHFKIYGSHYPGTNAKEGGQEGQKKQIGPA